MLRSSYHIKWIEKVIICLKRMCTLCEVEFCDPYYQLSFLIDIFGLGIG